MTTSTLPWPTPSTPVARRLLDRAARHGVTALRVSIGLVFLTFAIPKFVPGASPVEALVTRTVDALSFGLVTGHLAMVLVAALETCIALTLLTGRGLRLGLVALGGAMAGFFAPLALFPGDLFAGGLTLEAQYILKDVVLVTAAVVIAARRPGAPVPRRGR